MGPDLGIGGVSQSSLRGFILDLDLRCPGQPGPSYNGTNAGPCWPVLPVESKWELSGWSFLFSGRALSVSEGYSLVD